MRTRGERHSSTVPARPSPLPRPFDRGPFGTASALDAGVSESRLRAGDLLKPFKGVRSLEPVADVPALVRAYLPIMVPGEFFSHTTAALLHGMWLPLEHEEQLRAHVSVRKPQRAPRDRGVIGHHLIDRPGLVWDLGGVPVANPIDTWCQLGTILGLEDLVAAGDSLVAHGRPDQLLTLQRLHEAAADEHRPYHLLLAKAVTYVRSGSRSRGESRWRFVLVRRSVREPEINAVIRDDRGRWVAEVDLAWRRERLLSEYEGDGHRERKQFRKDIGRYEELHELGWYVHRATADDVDLHPDASAARILRLLQQRG